MIGDGSDMGASAIIVAAGKGTRMKSTSPKQYIALRGRPILSYTLHVFIACPAVDRVFLVVPENDLHWCETHLIKPLESENQVVLVAGGNERQESVYNGLMAIGSSDGIVAIHDGVRPLVTSEQLTMCIQEAHEHGACILAMPASDTIKRVDASGSIVETIDRKNLWLAQTPQAFRFDLIVRAHEQAKKNSRYDTDDARLVERLGQKIKVISGSIENIKITTEDDLRMAEMLLKTRQNHS